MSDQYPTIPTTPAGDPTQSKVNKLLNLAMHALLYLSIFLAGFIAAKFHTLLTTL